MTYRYIPEFMLARSQASRGAWEQRWDDIFWGRRGGKLGPKGEAYIEAKYGPEVGGDDLSDDWPDSGADDFDAEYTGAM